MALTTNVLGGFKAALMLCDSVVVAEGKLYVQGGGWDMVNPQMYPLRITRVGLAVTIDIPYNRTNENHNMTIRLKTEDGEDVALGTAAADPSDPAGVDKPVYEVGGMFNAGRPPLLQGGDSQKMPFAVNIDGLLITEPKAYYFVLEINGEEIERARFRALPLPPGQFTPGPR
jgi:hypothetical protein